MSNWDSTPWAIGGGADNSAETARLATFAATNGAEGIVGVTDLKVSARPVPGSGVVMGVGGLLVRSRYAGGDRQTYAGRLGIADPVDVANTGSAGGRIDLIAVIVDDPSQTGDGSAAPADPTNYQYIKTVVIPNVSGSVKRLQDVPAYKYATGYAVARVAQPANNGTITNAMITDLRRVAIPRKDRQVVAHAQTSAESERLLATGQAGEVFPDTSSAFRVDVPAWGTRAIIIATWSQVQAQYDPNGSAYGRLWVQLGADGDADKRTTQESSWDTVDAKSGAARYTYTVVDDIYVPAGLRDRTLQVTLRGRRSDTTAARETLTLDAVSGVAVDIEFKESAD